MQNQSDNFLTSVIRLSEYYKSLGEKAMVQLEEEHLNLRLNEESNSISTIVKHLWGNMLSRWTDFLNADGEKEWRERDAEFENDICGRHDIMAKWEEGWKCYLDALRALSPDDLTKIVYIRNQGHTVQDAIHRQLAHYSYHVGQLVFLAKVLVNHPWESLSIPRHGSIAYNAEKFSQEKRREHFTEDK
ncbi:MAG TPA: DUF1572 family protein [Saprospiraceae bacterium]|jgi:hypothetical protein|nr:MAG: hypothetical protein UZ08_BCD001000352 [Candidatus Parvibacillus calidus]MBX2937946.1 DUF1572 family protein [Saprospiraceae bacterium]MBX7179734.1 DUF1572 domain-containing protein [Saprospiraceae bacterium]MCB0589804.1 DUF1572 family protein [Saprospiraceae bacterium]MCO5282127.1 DUF1572 domain-containing protein [Saprospiraceae bacterium]